MTTNDESVTAENVTASRAQVSFASVSRCHDVTGDGRDVTSGRDSDRPPGGGSVTVTPSPQHAVVATVRPWPQYDDHGRGPFWSIRVQGPGIATSVSFAAHLGRFVYGHNLEHVLRRRGARQAICAAAASTMPVGSKVLL